MLNTREKSTFYPAEKAEQKVKSCLLSSWKCWIEGKKLSSIQLLPVGLMDPIRLGVFSDIARKRAENAITKKYASAIKNEPGSRSHDKKENKDNKKQKMHKQDKLNLKFEDTGR